MGSIIWLPTVHHLSVETFPSEALDLRPATKNLLTLVQAFLVLLNKTTEKHKMKFKVFVILEMGQQR